MPVFFQHRFSGAEIRVWNIEEEADFFQEALPSIHDLPAHPARRLQSLAARFLLRQQYPDFPFDEWTITDSGRPHLPNAPIQFSLSHAALYAAVITHPHLPVGIDIEPISERIHRVRKKFLSEQEERIIGSLTDELSADNLTAFLTLAWSVKEAAYKALHQTGVDFIRDLPISSMDLSIDTASNEYSICIGGKGSGLQVQGWVMSDVCLAIGVQGLENSV